MDIALAKMEHLHNQAQAMMNQQHQQQSRGSPPAGLGNGSPEPPNNPITMARGPPSLSAVHGAMLSHGHDLLSKLHKVSYSSPPPIACSPENNVCKLINYRGAKVAAFNVDGRELICLPQAFELFLKHLVGGLHTVYTKLKRLDILPVVCNVEQVRVLRGLGAIQPGVNRCKLISCKEFDVLYDDCTNSSARPGRPPKRSPSLHASPETIDKLKKSRFDAPDYYSARFFGGKPSTNSRNPDLTHPITTAPDSLIRKKNFLPFMTMKHPLLAHSVTLAMAQQFGLGYEGLQARDSVQGLDIEKNDSTKGFLNGFPPHPYSAMGHLPFMTMNHPLLAPPVTLAMAQQLGLRHEGLLARDSGQGLDTDRGSDREDSKDRPSPKPSDLPYHPAYHQKAHKGHDDDTPLNLHINGHAEDLRKSPSVKSDMSDFNDDIDDDNPSDDDQKSAGGSSDLLDTLSQGELGGERTAAPRSPFEPTMSNGSLPAYSSIETLLVNIQGLLKVAGENARHQEQQIGELKSELLKERCTREDLEKQMAEIRKQKHILLKRLRRERRSQKPSEESQSSTNQVLNSSMTSQASSQASDRVHMGQLYDTSPKMAASAEIDRRATPEDEPQRERFPSNSGSVDNNEMNGQTTGFKPSV